MIEKHGFQLVSHPLDRAVWTGGLRTLHSLFNSKKAAATVQMIAAESGDPKRLWRALDATLGLSQPSPDIPHTADQFSIFFADKVARIRALTANAAPPTFAASPSSTLNSFSAITEESLVDLIMRSPCKHSSMDPLPSWLLKQCVSLLAPFLTRLINLSIADSAVPKCMKMAIVTPILKKSNLDPADISNHRPVSNLSFVSKLLERAIKQ